MKEKIIRNSPSSYRKLEDIVGCKWSISVISAVAEGIVRPGAIEKHIEGISTKVLSERLKKLTRYGILAKITYHEVPPKTEYKLTESGIKLKNILLQIHYLDSEMQKNK
ncbi:MAG: helix-turn-helix domain-containing protein [Pseudomonadota bacterium]